MAMRDLGQLIILVYSLLLARILKNSGQELTIWPGLSFAADTDEGRHLL